MPPFSTFIRFPPDKDVTTSKSGSLVNVSGAEPNAILVSAAVPPIVPPPLGVIHCVPVTVLASTCPEAPTPLLKFMVPVDLNSLSTLNPLVI